MHAMLHLSRKLAANTTGIQHHNDPYAWVYFDWWWIILVILVFGVGSSLWVWPSVRYVYVRPAAEPGKTVKPIQSSVQSPMLVVRV